MLNKNCISEDAPSFGKHVDAACAIYIVMLELYVQATENDKCASTEWVEIRHHMMRLPANVRREVRLFIDSVEDIFDFPEID